jgi:hypothetical protein
MHDVLRIGTSSPKACHEATEQAFESQVRGVISSKMDSEKQMPVNE